MYVNDSEKKSNGKRGRGEREREKTLIHLRGEMHFYNSCV